MFLQVFLLGFNSQVVRDKRMYTAFFISWGIWTGQFHFVTIVSSATDATYAFLFGGLGGALGISLSIPFYEFTQKRKYREKNTNTH